MSVPREEELGRRRREIARRHHPDRGGDPARFLAEMARLERTTPVEAGPRTDRPTTGVPVRRPLRSLRRSGARLVLAARARLPRGVPGARRYGRL